MALVIDYERYGLAETKDRFSALTAKANATGLPFVALKRGNPWVEVRPLATAGQTANVSMALVCRDVPVTDLDELFTGYDGSYTPVEDGLSRPVGREVM